MHSVLFKYIYLSKKYIVSWFKEKERFYEV